MRYPLIRRVVRLPIKSRAFLHALLQLMDESFTAAAGDDQSDASTRQLAGDEAAEAEVSRSPATSPSPELTTEDGIKTVSEATFAAAVPAACSSSTSAAVASATRPPPKAPRSGGAPSSKIANIASKFPLRILLAEDNSINVRMMVMLMRRLGYDLTLIAADGVEALELLEREAAKGRDHEVECILMDASMDQMDGLECTRRIRSQQSPQRIRPFVIAQTANVTEEYQRECQQAGMDMFLCKVRAQRNTCSGSSSSSSSRPRMTQQRADAQGALLSRCGITGSDCIAVQCTDGERCSLMRYCCCCCCVLCDSVPNQPVHVEDLVRTLKTAYAHTHMNPTHTTTGHSPLGDTVTTTSHAPITALAAAAPLPS